MYFSARDRLTRSCSSGCLARRLDAPSRPHGRAGRLEIDELALDLKVSGQPPVRLQHSGAPAGADEPATGGPALGGVDLEDGVDLDGIELKGGSAFSPSRERT
jgi:hypothetical protein